MNWYVLYTSPRAEKQVEKRLEGMGIKTFLPLHLSPRCWSDRIKYVELPLFPSYIFVNTNDSTLRSLLTMQGISRIVFYDGKPAIIRQKEIDSIKLFLEKARGKEVIFTIGDDVLVVCGPLKDISGKIKRIEKKYILLHLEQLGITIRVSTDQVLKMKTICE